MDTNTFLLVALIVIVALVAYVVWRNRKVDVTAESGPVKFRMKTEKQTNRVAPPGAELTAGNVTDSEVLNEGVGGAAKTEVKDISGSKVTNTAGRAKQ